MNIDNPKPKTGNRKPASRRGQAAMEYLMTYGWAILVIVIVLAVLFFLLPMAQPPETCQFRQPGFSCSENPALILDQNGELFAVFNLQNGKGQTIILNSTLCTSASFTDAPGEEFRTNVKDTEKRIPAGATKTYNATCVDRDGDPIVMAPNTAFRGIVVIYYNYENDVTSILRPADATIAGTVIG